MTRAPSLNRQGPSDVAKVVKTFRTSIAISTIVLGKGNETYQLCYDRVE